MATRPAKAVPVVLVLATTLVSPSPGCTDAVTRVRATAPCELVAGGPSPSEHGLENWLVGPAAHAVHARSMDVPFPFDLREF